LHYSFIILTYKFGRIVPIQLKSVR